MQVSYRRAISSFRIYTCNYSLFVKFRIRGNNEHCVICLKEMFLGKKSISSVPFNPTVIHRLEHQFQQCFLKNSFYKNRFHCKKIFSLNIIHFQHQSCIFCNMFKTVFLLYVVYKTPREF